MANPGHLYDRSAAKMRKESGLSVYPVSLMIDLEGEHRPQDGVAQMVVALIPGQIGKQVLDGMVDVLLRGNLLVIPVEQRLPIFLRAVLGDLRGGEHGVRRQKVKRIRSGDLASYDYDNILRDKQRNINSLYELSDYFVDADPIFRGIIKGVYTPFALADDWR